MTTSIRSIEDDLARRHMWVAVRSEVELTRKGYKYSWIATIIHQGVEVARVRAESKGAAIEKAYELLPKE